MNEDHGISAWVDHDLCVGSGPCFTIAPGAFGLDENMKAIVLDPGVETAEALEQAARECPTQAIFLFRGRESVYP